MTDKTIKDPKDHSMEDPIHNSEYSIFHVGKALYGIDILNIQEINKSLDVTKVPKTSDFITGILNLRGKIVTIIDLGRKLGLDPVNSSKDNRNIIINSEGEYIGLLVDGISDTVQAEECSLDPVPSNIKGFNNKYYKGVLKIKNQVISVLDIDEILRC